MNMQRTLRREREMVLEFPAILARVLLRAVTIARRSFRLKTYGLKRVEERNREMGDGKSERNLKIGVLKNI